MITDIILLIIYFYIIPFIIVIVGYYIDFEGETLGEFKEDMFFMDEHADDPVSKFMQSTIPGMNIIVAFIFLVIGIIRCIKFPFKIINKKFDVWNKIKNLKIKKHI
ncbi:MAG: hypothetical protein [Bacteriophage sp.]|nr:MAG: hypothetical protein [Bacteriophage sp.]UWG15314.1 MAG: hypothetical protein [Bacteriophage sp.]UWI34893.1 MAG: hypothetical protein [Bacteriophage sp.]